MDPAVSGRVKVGRIKIEKFQKMCEPAFLHTDATDLAWAWFELL
jgi:hypothetical protein